MVFDHLHAVEDVNVKINTSKSAYSCSQTVSESFFSLGGNLSAQILANSDQTLDYPFIFFPPLIHMPCFALPWAIIKSYKLSKQSF